MARKPNYDFERKERERLKNLKKAARAEAKTKAEPQPDSNEGATPQEESAED